MRGTRIRRTLRLVQLGLGVWVVSALVRGLLPAPAYADNCSIFTDCFGVANSAVEAAFGLSLLAALSLVLDFVPIVGTAKGLVEAATGRDLLTGEELAAWERALGVLPVVGGLTAVKYVDDLAAAGRRLDDIPSGRVPDLPPTGRGAGDGLGDAGRAGDVAVVPTPASPTWPVGTRRALDPSAKPLVDAYRTGDTPTRKALAEQIGERGGVQYLSDTTGRPVGMLRPRTDADVTPLLDLVDRGEAWPDAVAFGGSRATNLVYFDGKKLIIVEAKGGGSGYGDRVSRLNPGQRIAQTDPDYPRDVAVDMRSSDRHDGRNAIGRLIRDFYRTQQVEYVAVRTGGYGDLTAGNPQVQLEHVFLRPAP